jgi:glycerol-3-phosphate dehydrogenase (NAD(P)+)
VSLAVLGGGAWGTALAAHAARAGQDVRLWVRRAEVEAQIRERHENEARLAGVRLPDRLAVTVDFARAVEGAGSVLVAVPSPACRETYERLDRVVPHDVTLVSATKGLEIATLRRMSEVAREACPGRPVAALSGPSFAAEVGREEPTAVVVAGESLAVAEAIQHRLATRTFRIYSSDDLVGVELGGALKNVIAIAAGIIDGLGHGHNTAAALITRGLAEISRLAVALGGRPDTLAGLAGLGDLVLTCTGALSRNRRVGQALGRGRSLEQALAPSLVAEGVRTTRAACDLAARAGIEMPICLQMREVLYGGKPPRAAVDELMLRSLKRE